jgi:hypothetical protein
LEVDMGKAKEEAAVALARLRWEGVSEEERKAATSKAGKARWAGMSKTARAREMARRRRKGLARLRAAKGGR